MGMGDHQIREPIATYKLIEPNHWTLKVPVDQCSTDLNREELARDLIETMKQLRNGRSDSSVMGRIAKGYSDREIILIANYFSSLTEDIKQM